MENSITLQYCAIVHQLTAKCRSSVRDIDPTNDLTFLRIRTKKHEIMIAPGMAHICKKKIVHIFLFRIFYNYSHGIDKKYNNVHLGIE